MLEFFRSLAAEITAAVTGIVLLFTGTPTTSPQPASPVQPRETATQQAPGPNAALRAAAEINLSLNHNDQTTTSQIVKSPPSSPFQPAGLPPQGGTATQVAVSIEPTPATISETTLNQRLAALKDELLARIAAIPSNGGGGSSLTIQSSGPYVTIDQFMRQVDAFGRSLQSISESIPAPVELTDATIPDDITASNYLPLSGGTLTGNLTLSGTASTTALVISNLNSADCDVKASTAGILSCGTDVGGSLGQSWSIIGSAYLAPTTTLGIIVSASSTIGNGTQAGGLTISGGATTTGNAYFGGIGTFGESSTARVRIDPTSQDFGNIAGAVYVGADGNTGLLADGGNRLIFQQFGTDVGMLTTGGFNTWANYQYRFAGVDNTGDRLGSQTFDAGIGRQAAGIVTITDGSTGNGGLLSLASTTIGNGTQAGGLTISGGATTTGNAYFAGNVNVGATSFDFNPKLGVYGSIVIPYQSGGGFLWSANTGGLLGVRLSDSSYAETPPTCDSCPGIYLGADWDTPNVHVGMARNTTSFVFNRSVDNATGDLFSLRENNTSRVVVNAAGNIGIGTTSPATKLDVAGGIRIAGGSGAPNATHGISFSLPGDTDGGITSPADGTLAFYTNFAEHLRISPAGRIGIGFTDPQFKLDLRSTGASVAGETDVLAAFYNTASFGAGTGGAIVLGGVANSGGGTTEFATVEGGKENATDGNSAGFFSVRTRANGGNLSEWMRVDSTGNVGIGTTTPGSKLTVSGVAQIYEGVLDLSAGYPIRWGGAASGIYSGAGTQDMVFTVGSNERFRINGLSGNVGIGTTTPSTYLTLDVGSPNNTNASTVGTLVSSNVAGGTGHTGYRTALTSSSGAANGFFRSVRGPATNYLGVEIGSENSPIRFLTNGTAPENERMRIDTAGNVGIGTTTPAHGLSISKTTDALGLRVNNDIGRVWLRLYTDNAEQEYGRFQTDFGGVTYVGGVGNFNFTGVSIGIGTTSPWRTLSVTGTVAFDGLTGATGAGSLCLSAANEVVFNSGSDACLPSLRSTKHAIDPLTLDALGQVLALRPVSFVYNDGDGRTRYGFIAEDTAQVDEHLATYNADGDLSGIDDRAVLSLVVKAIQSLAATIADFAQSFTSKEIHATNLLCIGATCINEQQLQALLGSAAAGAADTHTSTVADGPSAQSSTEPPIIAPQDDAATTTAASASSTPQAATNTPPPDEPVQPVPEPDNPEPTDADEPPALEPASDEEALLSPAPEPAAANDNFPPEDLQAAL